MASVSLCMVVGGYRSSIRKTLDSVKNIVDNIIIGNQGAPLPKDLVKKFDILEIKLTDKGNADPDRNLIASYAAEWVLMLDDDERLSVKLKSILKTLINSTNTDVYFIPFKNIVDSKDIYDILGDDYHPRLYRKGAVIWQDRLHAHPDIRSPFMMFLDSKYSIIHARTIKDVINSHKKRQRFINMDQQAFNLENQFLARLGAKFKRDLIKEVRGMVADFRSI